MRFAESETTWAYLLLMREVALAAGLPLALYSDRHDIFHARREPTLAEQLSNARPLTQFGRAMEELGVNIINEVHHERQVMTRFTAPVIVRLMRKSAERPSNGLRNQPQLLT